MLQEGSKTGTVRSLTLEYSCNVANSILLIEVKRIGMPLFKFLSWTEIDLLLWPLRRLRSKLTLNKPNVGIFSIED